MMTTRIPVRIWRGVTEGSCVVVAAAEAAGLVFVADLNALEMNDSLAMWWCGYNIRIDFY